MKVSLYIFVSAFICFNLLISPAFAKKDKSESSIKTTTVADYQVDYESLKGKLIQVKGICWAMDAKRILVNDTLGGANLFGDISKLNKEEKKWAIKNCTMIERCNATLKGYPVDSEKFTVTAITHE